jgi:hypothetical protein
MAQTPLEKAFAAVPVLRTTNPTTQRSSATSASSGYPGWRPVSSAAEIIVRASLAFDAQTLNAATSTSVPSHARGSSFAHSAARSDPYCSPSISTSTCCLPLPAAAVVAYQPFGDSLRFNPHFHALILEGGFDSSGQFYYLPIHDTARLSECLRRHTIGLFLKLGLISENSSLLPSCAGGIPAFPWTTPYASASRIPACGAPLISSHSSPSSSLGCPTHALLRLVLFTLQGSKLPVPMRQVELKC